jgi:hypothetical protein
MLEVADKLDDNSGFLCDAPTRTGRAIQAAIAVARATMVLPIRTIGRIEIAAADTVIGMMRDFLASKPGRRRYQQDEQKQMVRWNFATLLLLGGASAECLATWLDCDRSALRKRSQNDLETFDHKYGHFCKNHKHLRRKWQLPGLAIESAIMVIRIEERRLLRPPP